MARPFRTTWLGWFCALACAVSLSGQQPSPSPVNLDFETGAPGEMPPGWMLSNPQPQPGIAVRIVTDDPAQGAQAVTLTRAADAAATSSLNLLQLVDAAPLRGRRVRFRMAVKTASAAAPVQMWLRIDGAAAPGAQPPNLFLDNMLDRPIVNQTWRHFEIVTDVPAAAARIGFGAYLVGPGQAWLDDATFETVAKVDPPAPEAPRAITRRGLVNLMAFARLLGYVRHFHPSDEAAATDWNAFAIAGVRAVESSADGDVLTQRLGDLFRPIAPSLVVVPSGTPQPRTPDGPTPARQVIWNHLGFGLSTAQSSYRSDRVPLTGSARLFTAELGGGVAIRMPVSVEVDDMGTLPRGGPPAAAPPQLTRGRYPVNDRGTRLAAVTLAWNVLQHSYPYFDLVPVVWSTALSAALQEAATDQHEREFVATLRRMMAALRDGQARVTGLADAELQFMPPVALDWVENRLTVVAAEAPTGLVAGDVIVSIEGTPAPLMLEQAEAFISAATPRWQRVRAMQEILLGPRDGALKVRVERTDPAAPIDVTLARSVTSYAPPARTEIIAELEPGLFYVDVSRVTPAAFTAALPALAAARGIVFDLRNYPAFLGPEAFFAHLSDTPLNGPQFHVPQLPRPDREEMAFLRTGEWTITPQAPLLSARKVFLADARGISYIESCLAIVEAHKLGEIVGGPSAGTDGAVNRFQIPGDYTVTFTGTRVLKQNGGRHHGIGVAPTIPVERTRAGIQAGRDELLARALDTLRTP